MDDSVIVISEDEDGNGFKGQSSRPNILKYDRDKKIPEHNVRDVKETEGEQIPFNPKFLNNDVHNQALLEEYLDDAAFLDSASSDDELNVSNENGLDETPECGDFANWYSHESFSQPVLSSPLFKETLLTANEFITSSTSSEKRTPSICIARSAAKEEAKQKKKQERLEKKKRIEIEKQLARFEREVSAAKKQKNLDVATMKIFEDRGIRNQLLFDGSGMTVCWKRKILQGKVENDAFIRGEKLAQAEGFVYRIQTYEQFCILSMSAQRYDQFKSAEEIAGFIEESMKKYPFPSPQLTVIVHGLLKLGKEQVADFVLEIFERFRAQTRFVLKAEEYALLIAQMHRSIARNENRLKEQVLPIVNIEKGITEGDNSSIVSDWWMKMLSQIHRMGTDAQRTIVNTFPNPHVLSELLKTMSMKEGIKFLADIKMDCGKELDQC
ncbi:BMA-EME-1 [Dirofilaria immitis]|nr:BMA-EME-1 [Dirofilaria immitis]